MYTIECRIGFGKSDIGYLSYGTTGWLKTKDNEVRQCKCVGAKWGTKENTTGCSNGSAAIYEWKVAGIKEHMHGSMSRLPIGVIYTNVQDAQHGGTDEARKIGEMESNSTISIKDFLTAKYGLEAGCFRMQGTWDNILSLKTYSANPDNTVSLLATDFEITLDGNGIDIAVPLLDEPADGQRRFATRKEAYESMTPLFVHTLDEDE